MHPRCYGQHALVYAESVARRKRRRRQGKPSSVARLERRPAASAQPWRELSEVREPERIAYSRRQAAQALGVSVATIDRRVVPLLNTVKTPWGQRLIPVAELERFIREHLEPARPRPVRRNVGRPSILSPSVVDRIRSEHAQGRSLGEIARELTASQVPTAHGGVRWWPSTVRSIVRRSAK